MARFLATFPASFLQVAGQISGDVSGKSLSGSGLLLNEYRSGSGPVRKKIRKTGKKIRIRRTPDSPDFEVQNPDPGPDSPDFKIPPPAHP